MLWEGPREDDPEVRRPDRTRQGKAPRSDSRFARWLPETALRRGGVLERVMQLRWYLGIALCAVGVGACNSDSSGSPPSSDDGGDAAATDDASSGLDAGADSTTADRGADGPSADSHADSSPPEGASDASNPSDASDAGDASEPSLPTYALFVGTDFTEAELSVVTLSPDSVAGHLALDDEDSVAFASGGLGFAIERTLGEVIALNPAQPWTVRKTIDVNDGPDAAAYASNPQAVVVTAGTKAYVARYASNVLKVVDVVSGAASGTIDLSTFVAPDDPDGLVDVVDGTYDPTSNRAYFLLQRIDQFDYSGSPPDFVSLCLASHAEIVAVNAATDAIVPLTDASATGAINLLGDNPSSITADFANHRLIVPDVGCYAYPDGGADGGDTIRLGRGVESVDLVAATPAWLYETGELQRLSGIVYVDSTQAYVKEGDDWFSWNPTQTTLGATVSGFPQAAFYDGAGRIVGLSPSQPDGGSDAGVVWSVVALAVSSGQVSTIATAPFQSVVPAASYGVTSALVR